MRHGVDPVAQPPIELALICEDEVNYEYHYRLWMMRRWLILLKEMIGPIYQMAQRDLTPDEAKCVTYWCDYDPIKNQYVMKAELI